MIWCKEPRKTGTMMKKTAFQSWMPGSSPSSRTTRKVCVYLILRLCKTTGRAAWCTSTSLCPSKSASASLRLTISGSHKIKRSTRWARVVSSQLRARSKGVKTSYLPRIALNASSKLWCRRQRRKTRCHSSTTRKPTQWTKKRTQTRRTTPTSRTTTAIASRCSVK